MSDISMCRDEDCPRKNECRRFLDIPTPGYQSYFVGSPREENGDCMHFWRYKEKAPTEPPPKKKTGKRHHSK